MLWASAGWIVPLVIQADSELIGYVRATFGLDAHPTAALTAVGRGAAGQIWRLDLGPRRYALKELFRRPADEDVRRETEFTAHVAGAGVVLPASLPAVDGRFVVEIPDGLGDGWLRLYEWVDGVPVDPTADGVAEKLGDLLGRLHANARPAPDDADPWYDTTPDAATWSALADEAVERDVEWGPGLADRIALIAELSWLVTPTPPDRMIMCHRDLHPGNVLVDAAGRLVLLDWDDVGPACPDRELAIVLMRWHLGEDGRVDAAALRRALTAYEAAGGPGRLRDLRSFGMSVASDLNYLRRQAAAALDPDTLPEHRDFAATEIQDSFAMMSSIEVLEGVLALAGDRSQEVSCGSS